MGCIYSSHPAIGDRREQADSWLERAHCLGPAAHHRAGDIQPLDWQLLPDRYGAQAIRVAYDEVVLAGAADAAKSPATTWSPSHRIAALPGTAG